MQISRATSDLHRSHDDAVTRADNLLDMLSRRPSASLEENWAKVDAEAVKLKGDLVSAETALADAHAAVPASVHLARVNEVRAKLDDPDLDTRYSARVKVMTALRGTIGLMLFNVRPEKWMFLTKGRTHYFAIHKDCTLIDAVTSPLEVVAGKDIDAARAIQRRAGFDPLDPATIAAADLARAQIAWLDAEEGTPFPAY